MSSRATRCLRASRYCATSSNRPASRTLPKAKGAPGRAQLYIDGKLVGQADLPVTVPLLIGLGGGLTVGRNPGSPVSQLYGPPFAFTGTIFKVTADVSGQMLHDTEEERQAASKAAMSRQ